LDIRLRLLSTCLLLGAASACSGAKTPPDAKDTPDGVLSGRAVIDGKPAAGASVALDGSTVHASTDADGLFALHDLAPGQRGLTIAMTVDGRLYSARKRVDLAPSANAPLAASQAVGDVALVASANVTAASPVATSATADVRLVRRLLDTRP
jgi:hypothetical protein